MAIRTYSGVNLRSAITSFPVNIKPAGFPAAITVTGLDLDIEVDDKVAFELPGNDETGAVLLLDRFTTVEVFE